MGAVAKQYLLSTGTGTKRELDPTLAGAASTATAVTYALNGSGVRRFSPETSNSTVVTVPAAPATFSGVGWEMDATINADPVQFLDQAWAASLELAVTGHTTGPNVTLTVIYYVNGAEVGRHSESRTLFVGETITTFGMTAAELDEAIVSSANPRLQIEVYVNVTLAAVSLGVTTHTVRTNDADSFVDPGDYSLRASRTGTESVPVPGGSPARSLAYARSGAEAVASPAGTARRVAAYTRPVAETVPAAADTPARVATFPRSAAEVLPTIADSPRRVLTYARSVTEAVPAPADTPARVAAYARTGAESVTAPADSPRRVLAYARSVTEAVPAPADTPARQTTFRRTGAEVLPTIVDTPRRVLAYARTGAEAVAPIVDTAIKLVTYGRIVTHEFAVGGGGEGPVTPADITAIANAVWDELTAEARTGGSYGELVAARIDVAVSSRSTAAAVTALGTPAQDGDLAVLAARLTAVRAAALDLVDVATSTRSSSTAVATVSALVDDLEARLSAARALLLDNLDVAVSSRATGAAVTALGAPAQAPALSTLQGLVDDLEARLSPARALLLDNLDAAVSSRSNSAALAAVSALVDDLETRLSATRAALLDNLDAAVSSRARPADVAVTVVPAPYGAVS